MESIVDACWHHAQKRPDRVAVTFLDDRDGAAEHLTFAQLWQRAERLAGALRDLGLDGARVLLVFPSGFDFVVAFLACLMAKVLPAPVSVPSNPRNTVRMDRIAAAFSARNVLTTRDLQTQIRLPGSTLQFIACDEIVKTGHRFAFRGVHGGAPAFVQFTSGSTGTPKGVVVSHANIVENQRRIALAFGHDERTVFAGWLPLFHDMGLIGNLLHPLYLGVPTVLMSPQRFLADPSTWLRMISDFGATTSGGPNFAYDYCVAKVVEDVLEGIDLSCWRVAFNGSEPVREKTLRSFAEKFRPFGFSLRASIPCYGLAESTLFVCSRAAGTGPAVKSVDRNQLAAGVIDPSANGEDPGPTSRWVTLVGCGHTWLDDCLRVVDTNTGQPCQPGVIGEIWISSASVALGYWDKEALTSVVFQATIDGDARTYLRTGDLGFVDQNGELFVTGRISDLIIVRGRNYYPHDLEATAVSSHPKLGPTAAAVADGEEEQRIYMFLELRAGIAQQDLDGPTETEIKRRVAERVWEEHELRVHEIVLVPARSIPKTSSGKVRRRSCLDHTSGMVLVRERRGES